MDTARLNIVLLFVACLLTGIIAGYYTGSLESRDAAAGSTGALSDEATAMIMGFSCPVSGCNERLIDCNHDVALRVRTWINAKLAEGTSQEEISRNIIQQYGPNLFRLP